MKRLVRAATPADIQGMRALEQQSETAAHWAEREYDALFAAETPSRVALVASEENDPQAVLAFVIARVIGHEWEIENVVVVPSHRRRGLGSALIHELLLRASAAAATSVLLEVRESNEAARRLYESLGFTLQGRRPRYYERPTENALLLRFSIAVL